MKKRVMLVIMDGLGCGRDYPGNAVNLANKPNLDRFLQQYPHTTIQASGLAVGLPEGQMGNSEVGHLNIGSGRVIYQDLSLITKEINDGIFFENQALLNVVRSAKDNKKSIHLLGLLSKGGVHSHLDHVYALLELAKRNGLEKVYVHAFLDGRDVSPNAGLSDIEELISKMKEIGVGELATIIGRYYAMDRDKRWERVERAYNAMILGEGKLVSNPLISIDEEYSAGITDEFMTPTVIVDNNNQPISTIDDGDGVIFFNFRPDRARQITRALVDTDFDGFERKKTVATNYVCMTEYDKTIQNVLVAYPPKQILNTFGEIIARNGLKQLRVAETEKYAHVTFFFNGGVEKPNENEERLLVPSPKVATYDLQPEMSAFEVKDRVIEKMKAQDPDVIILNFANPDMVGHTGVIEAAKKAVETVDTCIGEIEKVALENGYELLITADHGNSEQLIDYETGEAFTAHTTNVVPLIYVTKESSISLLEDGKLSDLAPTMLDILNIEQPAEMTGHSLINRRN